MMKILEKLKRALIFPLAGIIFAASSLSLTTPVFADPTPQTPTPAPAITVPTTNNQNGNHNPTTTGNNTSTNLTITQLLLGTTPQPIKTQTPPKAPTSLKPRRNQKRNQKRKRLKRKLKMPAAILKLVDLAGLSVQLLPSSPALLIPFTT